MQLTQEQSRVAEEKSVCQKFWEMDYFLAGGGWQDLGRQSLENMIEIGERLMHSQNFEIKKNVEATVTDYKSILASLATRRPCED